MTIDLYTRFSCLLSGTLCVGKVDLSIKNSLDRTQKEELGGCMMKITSWCVKKDKDLYFRIFGQFVWEHRDFWPQLESSFFLRNGSSTSSRVVESAIYNHLYFFPKPSSLEGSLSLSIFFRAWLSRKKRILNDPKEFWRRKGGVEEVTRTCQKPLRFILNLKFWGLLETFSFPLSLSSTINTKTARDGSPPLYTLTVSIGSSRLVRVFSIYGCNNGGERWQLRCPPLIWTV